MIINGFGNNGGGTTISKTSANLVFSNSYTVTQTETISGKTSWPGGGSATTEYSLLLANLSAAYTPITSVIPQLLQKYKSLLLDIVVTHITTPTISFSGNFSGGTTTANTWPFRISVATGLGNNSYNFMNCYYRDCTQTVPVPFSSGTQTFTINAANFGALSTLNTQAMQHSISCIGYGAMPETFAYFTSTVAGSYSVLQSSSTPEFYCVTNNYGGLYVCLYNSMYNATSGHAPNSPTSFNLSGAKATLRMDIYGV